MAPRKLFSLHDARTKEIEEVRIAEIISAINRASDNIGSLKVVGGPGIHLLDFNGFRQVLVLRISVQHDVIWERVHGFNRGRALVEDDVKVVIVFSENLVGEELGEIIIDEIFGFSLPEERNVGFVDDEIKEVKVGASGQFVQKALAFRKRENARLNFGKMTSVIFLGEAFLLLANHALGALGGLIGLENGCGEHKIAPATTEVAGLVNENFNHGAIIAVLKNNTKHKRDGEVAKG